VGTTVRVAGDPRLDDVDRYGRLLRYVFKRQEERQPAPGDARRGEPLVLPGDRGRYANALLKAAEAARANGRGAWGACEADLDPLGAFETAHGSAPAPPAPVTASAQQASGCHPSYREACLDPAVSDYACAGGSGNGPEYVSARVRVVGPDDYGLDSDGDGVGCEG
jgi:hypothetical protein